MTITLPAYAPGQPAARVDAALRESLRACDRARECAVLWFAEVQRRALYRELGHASLQLYATQALRFSDNRYWQFKRLADDLDRLPALKSAVASGEVGWTKAQQVARVATPATQAAWVDRARTVGRRELEREVRAARGAPREAGSAQLSLAPVSGLAPAQVAAAVPATITLRGDSLQLARDRHRCATPGCGATRFLEIHHVKARRAGGANRPENLVTLCARCHAFAHVRNDAVRDRAQDQDGKSASEQRDVAIRPE